MASEKELVIYAKIGDHSGLGQASEILMQEQAQYKTDGGRIRVRKERPYNQPNGWVYTLTTKGNYRQEDGVQVCDEEDENITEKAYEMFKSVCKDYQRKVRFVFKVENIKIHAPGMEAALEVPELKYEVDVFATPKGELSTWCKIDVEIDTLLDAMSRAGMNTDQPLDLKLKLSSLPFKPVKAFMENKNDPKSKKLAWSLFEYEFNRLVGDPTPEQLQAEKQAAVERHEAAMEKARYQVEKTPIDLGYPNQEFMSSVSGLPLSIGTALVNAMESAESV